LVTLDSTPADATGRRNTVRVALHCATIFLSAALLFWLEPMFSKMVLPLLGGTSAVWSIAMVVFQGLLLAGYLYAHALTRLVSLKTGVLIHAFLLAVAALWFPIGMARGFEIVPEHGVAGWVIALFLMSVGLPCFALSANAPLLQAWFAASDDRDSANPYFLYRASNIGSFVVLLGYPFFIEPALGLSSQSRLWTLFYAVLAVGIIACGVAQGHVAPRQGHAPAGARSQQSSRLKWVALSFVPSGLLVAITAHISTDVASAPFLWVVPLALYLLTFVMCFTDRPLVPLKTWLALQPIAVGVLAVLFLWGIKLHWAIALPLHLLVFVIVAMVCHIQLYMSRPKASDLTEFYAYMSLGGVLGGIFAALVAPMLFNSVLEYPLLVIASIALRPDVLAASRATWLKDGLFVAIVTVALALPFLVMREVGSDTATAYFVLAAMGAAAYLALQGRHPVRLLGLAALLLLTINLYTPSQSLVGRFRSFYGMYKVVDMEDGKFRVVFHGTTSHGAEQVRDGRGRKPSGKPEPLTYYYRGGPFSEALEAARAADGGRLGHVALVGLGMGALSCYSQPGEKWDYYELDPLMVAIATDRRLFRSMSVCAPHASFVLGDGRISLGRQHEPIDLLLVDAFTSDSVPIHMLTKEAFALYKSRLTPHGVIALNISNRNMELASVVSASAAASSMVTAVKRDFKPLDTQRTLRSAAEIAVVARSTRDLAALKLKGWHVVTPQSGVATWTDDYSNVPAAILRKLESR
jgi:hypothetical protein